MQVDKDLLELCLDKFSFPVGRMIAESKSQYESRNPDNLVIFNANVCTHEHGKIWHGDLDITKSHDLLRKLAENMGVNIYILYEMDARFKYEEDPLLQKAAIVFQPGTDKVRVRKDLLDSLE